MNETPYVPTSDINDNDKLMAALSYFFAPIVGVIVLLVESMKSRPYQKYHALQSIGLGVAEWVVSIVLCICVTLLSFVGIGLCLTPLLFVPFLASLYYAFVAYTKPSYFEIPVVTKFMIQQGWLKV
jgi:uncharacterized membrane protein